MFVDVRGATSCRVRAGTPNSHLGDPHEKLDGFEITVSVSPEDRSRLMDLLGDRAVLFKPRVPFRGTNECWRTTIWSFEIADARYVLRALEEAGAKVNYTGMATEVRNALLLSGSQDDEYRRT